MAAAAAAAVYAGLCVRPPPPTWPKNIFPRSSSSFLLGVGVVLSPTARKHYHTIHNNNPTRFTCFSPGSYYIFFSKCVCVCSDSSSLFKRLVNYKQQGKKISKPTPLMFNPNFYNTKIETFSIYNTLYTVYMYFSVWRIVVDCWCRGGKYHFFFSDWIFLVFSLLLSLSRSTRHRHEFGRWNDKKSVYTIYVYIYMLHTHWEKWIERERNIIINTPPKSSFFSLSLSL